MTADAPARSIAGQVAGFVAHLRKSEFALGPAETAAALSAISGAVPSVATVRRRLKVVLASRPGEWRRFDALFDDYWLGSGAQLQTGEALGASAVAGAGESSDPTRLDGGSGKDAGGSAPAAVMSAEEGSPTASSAAAADSFARADFADLADPEELAAAEQAARRLAEAIRRRVSRRIRAGRRGPRLDLRRIVRASLARGGEPIELVRRRRSEQPLRIVVFLDVSGSMKPYSRFLLQFVRGLAGQSLAVDVWLVHTKLIRATVALAEPSPKAAMHRLARLAQGFGGGTRLGSSLRRFNEAHAKRALDGRTVVIVMSDGYDTGSGETLANELARIERRARSILWLNPLAGRAGYRPVALAMLAALPHVDRLAPANSLAALAAIESELMRL